ncbi:class I SAM-dependent methyltransferase [Kineococcus sp. SYSU DK005]|uniref:class I SAM-dependent methyltransferase n=1 Tax=Kineococcus sp. SYSU DK005 TaxID=3383126 RepID=UPI003D7CAEB5
MPTTDLATALSDVRALLLDEQHLVRAVAAGRRRGLEPPEHERVEVRPVALRSGPHLQFTARTGPVVSTRNVPAAQAAGAVDALLAQPHGNWHVETAAQTVQLRVTKKGEAQVHRTAREGAAPAGPQAHDRPKQRLVDPDDPVFRVLGAGGDKRRQVEAFVRQLAPLAPGVLEQAGPVVRAVDLGCGNAYLTFAAHRWLSQRAAADGRELRTVGVDVREDVLEHGRRAAREAGLDGLGFARGTIAAAEPFAPGERPDVVVALHACDTATDEALARAVRWGAPLVLAAPCCHRDVQRQIAASGERGPVVRHAILRERFADVLTDALRALVLQLLGYRVEVVEFIDSAHTPRNAMLRAVRTGSAPRAEHLAEFDGLCREWGVQPALAAALAPELDAVRSALAQGAAGDREPQAAL